jgi:hypothetical protein
MLDMEDSEKVEGRDEEHAHPSERRPDLRKQSEMTSFTTNVAALGTAVLRIPDIGQAVAAVRSGHTGVMPDGAWPSAQGSEAGPKRGEMQRSDQADRLQRR